MKALKGLLYSLIGLLLFLSLSFLGLVLTLRLTVLDPVFIQNELGRIDIPQLLEEIIGFESNEDTEYLVTVIYDTFDATEVWMQEQVNNVVDTFYDYIYGNSDTLEITVQLQTFRDALFTNISRALDESPPEEIPAGMMDEYEQKVLEMLDSQIPEHIDFTGSMLPPDVMTVLQTVRHYVPRITPIFYGLAVICALLIIFILLLQWNVRGSTRTLGSTFFTYGLCEYVGIYLINYLVLMRAPYGGVPSLLQPWIPQVIGDILEPLEIYSLVCVGIGLALLIISCVYRPKTNELHD